MKAAKKWNQVRPEGPTPVDRMSQLNRKQGGAEPLIWEPLLERDI